MRYIVDSNSFITPHRGYSPIDVARSLWSKISSLASEHKIYSLDKVKEELYLHDDELKEWMKANMPSDYFLSSDHAEVITKLQEILHGLIVILSTLQRPNRSSSEWIRLIFIW